MIQFISHRTDEISCLDGIRMALDGGCKWIQLRMKDSPEEEIVRTGIQVRELCDRYGATMILDDHTHLVSETGADGVHLGKSDMPIGHARAILGKDRIIGGTANTFEDIVSHWKAGADYIGCGPFRFTTTKKNLAPTLGLDGYRELTWAARSEGVNIPIVAIGGITVSDIADIMTSGPDGIALSGEIIRSADMTAKTTEVMKAIEAAKRQEL